MNVSGSPSASSPVAVATSTSFLRGVVSLSDTATTGAEFAMTAAADAGELSRVPSDAVTWTLIVSPRSPLPASERSKPSAGFGPVAVSKVTPLTCHLNV